MYLVWEIDKLIALSVRGENKSPGANGGMMKQVGKRKRRKIVVEVGLALIIGPLQLPSLLGYEHFGEKWFEVRGEAIGAADPEILRIKAKSDALTEALLRNLKTLLTSREIEVYEQLLMKHLFSRPESFLAAVSDETFLLQRNRILYRARVRFDLEKINKVLEEIGIRDPLHRPPLISITFSTDSQKSAEYIRILLKMFMDYGITFTEAENRDAFVRMEISVRFSAVPHPLIPEEEIPRYLLELKLTGDFGLRSFFLPSPDDPFSPPLSETALPLILFLYEEWQRHLVQVLTKKSWVLGPLFFPNLDAWEAFHNAILSRTDLFHHLRLQRIKKEKGFWVEYRFSLNPGEEVNAKAWLHNRGIKVKEEGNRLIP